MHKLRHNSKQGFTIVELLIVIVVIGILAAISIVAYRGVQDSANNAAVKNDLANAAKALELIKVDLGRYPSDIENEFSASNIFKFSKKAYDRGANNALYCRNIDTDSYALGARSKSGQAYMLINGMINEGMFTDNDSVCSAVGAITWGPSAVPHTTAHGFRPSGLPPNYIDGWNVWWTWTN